MSPYSLPSYTHVSDPRASFRRGNQGLHWPWLSELMGRQLTFFLTKGREAALVIPEGVYLPEMKVGCVLLWLKKKLGHLEQEEGFQECDPPTVSSQPDSCSGHGPRSHEPEATHSALQAPGKGLWGGTVQGRGLGRWVAGCLPFPGLSQQLKLSL